MRALSGEPSCRNYICHQRYIGTDGGQLHFQLIFITSLISYGRALDKLLECCPTCQQLLLLLGTGKALFVIRGSHSTVTACTLPTWLPAHVVDSMNNIFGDQLRWELLNLIESSELLWKCAQSTGSQRLSSDSTEQPGNDNLISMSKDFLRRAGVGRE